MARKRRSTTFRAVREEVRAALFPALRESSMWQRVKEIAQYLQPRIGKQEPLADELESIALAALEQLSRGVHENPRHISLDALIGEAAQAARARGHRLGIWDKDHLGAATGRGRRGRATATCVRCGAWVQVLTHPAPNEIDIGGPAVALECPVTGRR